jgi:hypothetical protein
VGAEIWGVVQHEPLLMHLSFPLCRHPPWSLKGTRYLNEFLGELRGVWKDMPGREGTLLCELLRRTRTLQSLPQGVVWKMLSDPLLSQLDLEWEASTAVRERKRIADVGFLLSSGFLCGLRGEEIMKIDLSSVIKYLEVGGRHPTCPHVIVALLGRLKGETGERYHMMVMARVSRSGIDGGVWADRVAEVNIGSGRRKGYMFTRGKERQAKIANFESKLIKRIEGLRMIRPGLFKPGIDIAEAYSLFRSLRRC